ncbi:MAG: hypothetical protein NZ899_02100 [Thermoguttaceae bacterium]|nr:hypothetical protein [Thermoguttaceae bacterium]
MRHAVSIHWALRPFGKLRRMVLSSCVQHCPGGYERPGCTPPGHINKWEVSFLVIVIAFGALLPNAWGQSFGEPAGPLPNSLPLELEGDLASRMIDGIHVFLDRYLPLVREERLKTWGELLAPLPSKGSSSASVPEKLNELRHRLRRICGVRDNLTAKPRLFIKSAVDQTAVVARSEHVDIYEVFWPAFDDVTGEGLLLLPRGEKPLASVVAIPDADQTPEELAALREVKSGWAMRLAQAGCRVLIPALVSRQIRQVYNVRLTQREYVYRSAYELGRHILGYDTQKVLAGAMALRSFGTPEGQSTTSGLPIGLAGWGEGGQIALIAAALCGGSGFDWPPAAPKPSWPSTQWQPQLTQDRSPALPPLKINAVLVGGFFGPRELMWQEPADRNIFSFVKTFGCAELVALSQPARVLIEHSEHPQVTVPPGLGGSPGQISTPSVEQVKAEFDRAVSLRETMRQFVDVSSAPILLIGDDTTPTPALGEKALSLFLGALLGKDKVELAPVLAVEHLRETNPAEREARQIQELERHNQWVLEESRFLRRERLPFTDTGIAKKVPLEEFVQTMKREREFFYSEVIGRINQPVAAPIARARQWRSREKWTGYEVVIDVFPPEVFAYGILLVPKDLRPDERRPVVVCQHGLEGRPQDTIEGDHPAYHDFAARLAERGFVVFAPQNPYIFRDRFRLLQRKLNPLGCTLFSVIIPQHAQILRWLKSLPFVDSSRIGFYGLSYGGKTAMRVPAVLEDYCLSICSADFNEWVWKNAAINTRGRYSYVFTGEYEIFEFDLGSTFNYAEMAALIAPRPFMVERGHFDPVAPDETVAYEFAKVRYLYAAVLGLADRCNIEWFVGPHTINGQGTFEFLHRFLSWPKPATPATSSTQEETHGTQSR